MSELELACDDLLGVITSSWWPVHNRVQLFARSGGPDVGGWHAMREVCESFMGALSLGQASDIVTALEALSDAVSCISTYEAEDTGSEATAECCNFGTKHALEQCAPPGAPCHSLCTASTGPARAINIVCTTGTRSR